MFKKHTGNVTFQYQSYYYGSITFETSNLREMIRWLKNLPESRYPGTLKISSNTGVFDDVYIAELANSDSSAYEVVDKVKCMMEDLCVKYGSPDARIEMKDDASDMELFMFLDDDKIPNSITFSSITDINNINHPITLYLFVLFKEMIGEPIGRNC